MNRSSVRFRQAAPPETAGERPAVCAQQATSGFDRTVVDTILRWAGIDTLVLVGVATDVAVESTARGACDLGYRTIVVSDARTADSDQAQARSLEVFQTWFGGIPTADQVLSAWDS
jgi:biuret amidohydrolase